MEAGPPRASRFQHCNKNHYWKREVQHYLTTTNVPAHDHTTRRQQSPPPPSRHKNLHHHAIPFILLPRPRVAVPALGRASPCFPLPVAVYRASAPCSGDAATSPRNSLYPAPPSPSCRSRSRKRAAPCSGDAAPPSPRAHRWRSALPADPASIRRCSRANRPE